MSKHTPGPWTQHDGCPRCVETKYGCAICETELVWSSIQDYDEQVANAKLIAAAPELLNALRDLVINLEHTDEEGLIGHCEFIISAKAAIEKATR